MEGNKSHVAFAVIFLAAMAVVLLGGCNRPVDQDSEVEQGQEMEFSTIDRGSYSGVGDRRFVTVRNQSEWENLWRKHTALIVPPAEVPPVDFSLEMILAVFDGQHSTGGYTIEITSIRETSDMIIVDVTSTSPPPGAIVTQAFTQPYHIVKVKRSVKSVVFEHLQR